MNTRQASLLLEQAIDVCQSPEPACPSADDLQIVAGLLVAFRDGWFAERRAGADRQGPRVPDVPPLTARAQAAGRTHRIGVGWYHAFDMSPADVDACGSTPEFEV